MSRARLRPARSTGGPSCDCAFLARAAAVSPLFDFAIFDGDSRGDHTHKPMKEKKVARGTSTPQAFPTIEPFNALFRFAILEQRELSLRP